MPELKWNINEASKGARNISEFFEIDGVRLADMSRKQLEDLIIMIYYTNLKTAETEE